MKFLRCFTPGKKLLLDSDRRYDVADRLLPFSVDHTQPEGVVQNFVAWGRRSYFVSFSTSLHDAKFTKVGVKPGGWYISDQNLLAFETVRRACVARRPHVRAQGACLIYKQRRNDMGYRFAVFYSRLNGRSYVIDLWRKRLNDLRKRISAWCDLSSKVFTKGCKRCLITLTYDTQGTLYEASEWSPKHVKVFMDRLKKKRGLDVLAYAWVVELQERGVPHYHIILIYKGHVPYPDKSGLWLYGMSNVTFKVRTPYYLLTYLGKSYQKNFSLLPKGARAYATSFTDAGYRNELRVLLQPKHIQQRIRDEGWDAVLDLVKPQWMRAEYLGAAETVNYAEMLAENHSRDS